MSQLFVHNAPTCSRCGGQTCQCAGRPNATQDDDDAPFGFGPTVNAEGESDIPGLPAEFPTGIVFNQDEDVFDPVMNIDWSEPSEDAELSDADDAADGPAPVREIVWD